MSLLLKILAVLLVTVVFIVSVLVHLPAAVAWELLQKSVDLRSVPVQPSQLSGTLLDGSGLFAIASTGDRFLLNWQIDFSALLKGDSYLSAGVRAKGIELDARGAAGFDVADLTLNGQVDLAVFEPILSKNRLSLGGLVDVNAARARYDLHNDVLLSVDGRLQWPGGQVSYPVGQDLKTALIPPLRGDLLELNQQPTLNVVLDGSGEPLLSAALQNDGVLALEVRKRLLDVAGAPFSDNAAADDIVFRLKQPLGAR